jgi:hypothetical protein
MVSPILCVTKVLQGITRESWGQDSRVSAVHFFARAAESVTKMTHIDAGMTRKGCRERDVIPDKPRSGAIRDPLIITLRFAFVAR